MAATKGIPLSEFARLAIDGVPVRARYQAKRSVDPDLVRELARIGNNLNQIARACNRRDIIAQRLDVLASLVNIDRELSMIRAFYEDQSLAAEARVADHLQGERELPYPINNSSHEDFE